MLCALLVPLAASLSRAQAPSVQGVVFDSLRGGPLVGAFVTVVGVGRATTSDSAGRFRFDSLGPGQYTFAIQHDVLDSIGVGSVSTRASVRGAEDVVTIAVPSFASLWRRWCQGDAPKDTGFVHGIVRDAAGAPLSNATVEVSWTDYSASGKSLQQRAKLGRVTTDGGGSYALCGVPANTAFRIRAIHDSAVSGSLDLVLAELRVSRRDLRVVRATKESGTIAGIVTQSGRPFAGARVVIAERSEQRSGNDGKFVVRDVPAGTQQVEIFAVGMSPGTIAVDVPVHDTVLVTYDLQKVVALPGVKVEATAARRRIVADIEDRRREGLGHFRDSTEISSAAGLATVFETIPGVRVVSKGSRVDAIKLPATRGECDAMYLVDGFPVDSTQLTELTPDKVALIEVYPRASTVPSSIGVKLRRRPTCGVVAVWTRRFIP
jgi:hypothetical protein